MDGNYIKLSRGLLEWEWYADINTTRLFIHMLLKANWKDGNFKGTTVPRGSFVSSIGKLSSETGLTEREIRTAISHLKTTGEVTSKTTNRFTVFTVVKYDLYQTNDKQNVSQEPVKRQPNDILTTTIEEKKEGEEINNNAGACMGFDDFWSRYPKQAHRMLAEQAYCSLVISGITESDLITAGANYAECCKVKRTQAEFISAPDNWLAKSKWIDYTAENYKKPAVKEEKSKGTMNKFNNFDQRNYDFDALEQRLTGGIRDGKKDI